MSNDYEIYEGMNLSDLFKKIDNNTKRNKIQIESLIQELMVFIKDPNTAIQLFPMISDFTEANIRNDELLVKLAAVVQRVMSVEGKSDSTEFGLSDEEKKGILDRISKATETIQNEVDDINLQIQE
jgi:hypothetical protein|tara:strand:- start:134 stop:511 length:378 start_codon:yes stop_codon:yes gene_type:complete